MHLPRYMNFYSRMENTMGGATSLASRTAGLLGGHDELFCRIMAELVDILLMRKL